MTRLLHRCGSALVCLLVFFNLSISAFASGGQLVETKPTVDNLPVSQQKSLQFYLDLYEKLVDSIDQGMRRQEKIISLNRLYYFSLMIDNSLGCSYSVSSGLNFNDDYLWFYFDFYLSHVNWTDSTSIDFFTVANSDGIITDVTALQFEIENLAFFPSNWTGRNVYWSLLDPPSYFKKFKDYYNYLYSVYISDSSLTSDSLSGVADPVISTDTFKDVIQEQNKTISPKNREYYTYSWRELSDNLENYSPGTLARGIFKNGKFTFGSSSEDGIYIQPYWFDGASSWFYTPYQYHLYRTVTTTDTSPNGSTAPLNTYHWYVEPIYYKTQDGESLDKFTVEICALSDTLDSSGNVVSADYCASVGWCPAASTYNTLPLYFYDTTIDCYNNLNNKGPFELARFGSGTTPNYVSYGSYFLNSSDVTVRYTCTSVGDHFSLSSGRYSQAKASEHTADYWGNVCAYPDTDDFGLYLSNEPFSTVYQFDTARLPSNSYVTISGDSVYDYSITDNSTGATTTINNYVNNDYNYPVEDPGDTSGGSNAGTNGSLNGNINVSGNVSVGGKVDINVNVSGLNGGNNGNNGALSCDNNCPCICHKLPADYSGDISYSCPDNCPCVCHYPDMGEYLDFAKEETTGFRRFLEDFFSFLPPQVLGLICLGVVVAIICRILGR